MVHTAADDPRPHRYTVGDYNRMAETGILAPDARVELIDGEIFDMAPPGDLHAGTVDQLVHVLSQAIGTRAWLRVQSPLALNEHSEPQPDISVLKPHANFYKFRRPQPPDTLLVIEVADTSLRFDRERKIPLYAQHGIPEAWLVDLQGKRLVRYRNPEDGAYALVDQPDLRPPLAIATLRDTRVDLADLFA